jgi:putative ABC transport system permease protein
MRISLLSIGLFSSLMALLILYILFSLLIDENSRSIALLKILGYEAREIRTLMLRIFDAPFLLGFLAGIPLLFEFYGGMMEQSFQEINMTMPLHLSLANILSGFAILYLTYLLTRNLSGRKILRIAMTDVLKSMQE